MIDKHHNAPPKGLLADPFGHFQYPTPPYHVTEDAEMRSVAEWKTFTAGWRIGAHGHEQIGSGS
jgi:hypothetical protein